MKVFKIVAAVVMICCLAFGMVYAESKDITYESRGVQVPATLVTPDGLDSYPIVIMLHGHGGTRNENEGYPAIAEGLAERGVASLRMDFSGCGESTEPFTMNNLSNIKADALAGMEWAKANLPVTKIGVFGYSMGGRAVISMLADGNTFDAVGMLAPAATNVKYGERAKTELPEAREKGFYTYTTVWGQVQELAPQWYEDLLATDFDDIKVAAKATLGDTPTVVLWAEDDATIEPAVSAAVAEYFGAKTVDASGNSHSYSFYTTEMPELREKIVNAVGDFFAEALK